MKGSDIKKGDRTYNQGGTSMKGKEETDMK